MDNEIPAENNFIPFILLPLKTCQLAESSYHSIYQTSVIVLLPKMKYSCCFILGDVPFVLWSVLVKLLYDDEPVVRERMALGFASLLKRIQSSWLGKYTYS